MDPAHNLGIVADFRSAPDAVRSEGPIYDIETETSAYEKFPQKNSLRLLTALKSRLYSVINLTKTPFYTTTGARALTLIEAHSYLQVNLAKLVGRA